MTFRSIPIASIVTPVTLFVQNIAVQLSKLTPVPKFGFTNYDFVAPLEVGVSSGTNYSELVCLHPRETLESRSLFSKKQHIDTCTY